MARPQKPKRGAPRLGRKAGQTKLTRSSKDGKPLRCPIVGVGGSAGGFEAAMELLRHLPGKNGMAFVIMQHLDPHHSS
jgi:chemotaxis response regulator CheB